MLIVGIILTIVGGIMTAWGKNQQNSWEYSVAKAFGSSSDTAGADIVFYIGLLLLIVGIVLFVVACVKKISASKAGYTPPKNYGTTPSLNTPINPMVKCTSCGSDIDSTMAFCPNCGSAKGSLPPKIYTPQFCHSCGAQLNSGEAFCHECGNKVE